MIYLTLMCCNNYFKYLCTETNTYTIVHTHSPYRQIPFGLGRRWDSARREWINQLCIWFGGLDYCSFLSVCGCWLCKEQDAMMSFWPWSSRAEWALVLWTGPRFTSTIHPLCTHLLCSTTSSALFSQHAHHIQKYHILCKCYCFAEFLLYVVQYYMQRDEN